MGASYLLLFLSLLVYGPAVAIAQGLPPCTLLGAAVRAVPWKIRPGGKSLVAAKVVNARAAPVNGLALRVDLPTGLVGYPRNDVPVLAPGVNGTISAYWTGLSLGGRKTLVVKLRVRACATAPARTYPIGGALYLVNSTKAVTCRTPIPRPATVCVCVSLTDKGMQSKVERHIRPILLYHRSR